MFMVVDWIYLIVLLKMVPCVPGSRFNWFLTSIPALTRPTLSFTTTYQLVSLFLFISSPNPSNKRLVQFCIATEMEPDATPSLFDPSNNAHREQYRRYRHRRRQSARVLCNCFVLVEVYRPADNRMNCLVLQQY